jgi:hypothetical protein
MMAEATNPISGAAKVVVPKKGMGIAFWMEGVPGSADMVKLEVPSAIAAGIRRRGIAAALNKPSAIGASRMPRRPIASDAVQQGIEIER